MNTAFQQQLSVPTTPKPIQKSQHFESSTLSLTVSSWIRFRRKVQMNFLDNQPLHAWRIYKQSCLLSQIRPKWAIFIYHSYTRIYKYMILFRFNLIRLFIPKAMLLGCNMYAFAAQKHVDWLPKCCFFAREVNPFVIKFDFSRSKISCLHPPSLSFFSSLKVYRCRFRGKKRWINTT